MNGTNRILMLSFFIVAMLIPQQILAEDMSSLHFYLTARRNPIGVSMVLTDPSGRRTGINLNTNFFVEEIPNSNKSFGGISNDMTGETGPQSMHIELLGPVPTGSYQLNLFGSTSTVFFLTIGSENSAGDLTDFRIQSVINENETLGYVFNYSSLPGSAPILKKQVSFITLRTALRTWLSLGQLGDDKFLRSLTHTLTQAEKQAGKCEKKGKKKCSSAVALLEVFIRRLEISNHKCDDNTSDCNEDREWEDFKKRHGKDDDLKEFFDDWEKDDWHRWKKTCKRFVSELAFKSLTSDAETLIVELGGRLKPGKDKDD